LVEYVLFLLSPIHYLTDEGDNVNLFVNHFFLHPQSYILAHPAHKASKIIPLPKLLEYLFMSCRAHAVLTRTNTLRNGITAWIILLRMIIKSLFTFHETNLFCLFLLLKIYKSLRAEPTAGKACPKIWEELRFFIFVILSFIFHFFLKWSSFFF
jgi:hypothetical protein